jgi:Domain of unknown function (DUF4253)
MAMNRLPEDGELQLAAVSLPSGRQIHAGYGSGGPVAWATTEPVPDAGRVWAALSRAHPGTGLVPFLLSGLDGDPRRPWDEEEFGDPEDISGLDSLGASAFLQPRWDGFVPSEDEDEDEEEVRAALGPFSRTFPGLAPAEDTPLSAQQLDAVLGSLPAARIGLAAAGRPADVLPRIGWRGDRDPLEFPAVLRSWEDRFGARLLQVGFDEIRLLAERPPRTLQAARHVAAEHCAFCDECAGKALRDIPGVAAHLLKTPIWTFWWD